MKDGWTFDAHIGMPDDPVLLCALRTFATPGRNLRNPERCKPGRDEAAREREELKGNTGKIVFAGEREARGFCQAVIDDDKLEPYYCERGHWHVRNIVKNRHVQGWRYRDRPE